MPNHDDKIEPAYSLAERLQAIEDMRRLTGEFLAGRVDFAEFFPALSTIHGTKFDPIDWAVADLPPAAEEWVWFFSEWLGGEFGEFEDRIPRRPDWRYGIDLEPYGWVDVPRYRADLRRAIEELEARIHDDRSPTD